MENTSQFAIAYQNHNGNLSAAARALNIHRGTLRARLIEEKVLSDASLAKRRKDQGKAQGVGGVTKPAPVFAKADDPSQPTTSAPDGLRGLRELITGNPLSVLDVCEKLDAGPGSVRQWLTALNGGVQSDGERYWIEKPAPVVAETSPIKEDIRRANLESELKLYKDRYKAALKEVQDAQALLEAQAALGQASPRAILAPPSGGKGEATAVIIGSDWHCGAIVRPNTVNFLNEFDVEIFQERADNFFVNSAKLVNKEQRDVGINHILFGLIGDLIENSLHDELIEEQTHSPIQQMQIAEASVLAGLRYWLTTDIAQITIVTAPGNHGRLTEKMRAATNWKNSLEMLLYQSLALHFRDEPRIHFQISDGYFNYFDLYGETIAFHHGDAIKSGGGVGGISIPLRKFLYRAQSQRRFTMSVNGHFHTQRVEDDFMINGSLVGPTAYGMRFGFAPERPQQVFRLLDAEEGFTGYFPILVKKRGEK